MNAPAAAPADRIRRRPAGASPALEARWAPPPGCLHRDVAVSLVWALLIAAPMLGVGAWMMYSGWRVREDARLAEVENSLAYERLVAAEPLAVVPISEALHGRELFADTCAACHGAGAEGKLNLGKNLVESDFVARQDDAQMLEFLRSGRPGARPTPMPPRGGRSDYTDADLRDVVSYLRGVQDARRMPTLPAMVVSTEPTEAMKAAALQAAGGDAELAGYIAHGDKLFHSLCIACHGKGGVGIAGNGKALVKNAFIGSKDDDSLLAFIKTGRAPSDPKNTTGIQMPPKGGNPAMSDDDLLDVIAYLRTLQGPPTAPVAASK